jgi:GNAT superfamily N-acetyltransferase
MKSMDIEHMKNPSDTITFLKEYAAALEDPGVVPKMQNLFSRVSCEGLLAMKDDAVIALALYTRDEPSIIGCLVLPAYEGHHIEKLLIEEVVTELQEGGASKIQGGFLMNHPEVHIPIREELQSLGFITAEELEMALSFSQYEIPSVVLDPEYSVVSYSSSHKQDMITIKFEGNRGPTGNPLVHGVSSREETEQEVQKVLSGTFGAFLPSASVMLLHKREPMGCTTCVRRPDGTAILTNVTILPQYRNRGLGKALVTESLHRLHRLRVSWVQLSVVASNESAMKIYRDLGFEEIARICYYRWMKEP